LSLGAMRAMKRTVDQIKAFEIAKAVVPDLQLKIAGKSDGEYGQKVMMEIANSPYGDDIEYLGKVSQKEKIQLMQKAHVILQTAVQEGWGLTVTEAASQGTPAVVYDVNGLRDSVKHYRTGLITDPSPSSLAYGIVKILTHPELYDHLDY
jgi:glycosyltransferase involved in cell wall biosynthesis